MNNAQSYDYAAKVWNETNEYDSVLSHLRRNGFNKLDSIKALREFCGVSLGDAKRIANNSHVWRDTVGDSEKLHEAFFDGATEKD